MYLNGSSLTPYTKLVTSGVADLSQELRLDACAALNGDIADRTVKRTDRARTGTGIQGRMAKAETESAADGIDTLIVGSCGPVSGLVQEP